jgi:hypothetical protein
LQIIGCNGYELEKEKSNTPEDLFNRSEITFLEDGKEKTLHVLYVRYFEQIFQEFTPYQQDPIFDVGGNGVYFKDIVALVCLLKNPGLRQRKRIYLNSKQEFASYFQGIDFTKLPEIFQILKHKKSYELGSPLEFIVQPS